MGDNSRIEWTEASWNPVTGCTKVSAGCDNCYAETLAERFRGTPGHYYEQGFDVVLRPDKLDQPLKWKKPRRVFVNSMSDLFHDGVPDSFIFEVFARMWWAPSHTFQLLTKRHGRMRSLMPQIEANLRRREADLALVDCPTPLTWPLPNLWLGVSVEEQKRANIRVPQLIATPAAVRWLSCEPLLGPVDLSMLLPREFERQQGGYWLYGNDTHGADKQWMPGKALHWVVAGGESGRGARPMHPDWARSLRDQCIEAGVPFFFKQWGESLPLIGHREFLDLPPARGNRDWSRPFGDDVTMVRVGKKDAGRLLDGRAWDEYPG